MRAERWNGPNHFGELIGASAAMRSLFAQLAAAADSRLSVLLIGETGTGKELAARAIHEHSARAAAPFIVVDPGTLSGQLASSELFGHVRGAFTGAVSDRDGAFMAADGGTLFLDELGDLDPAVQAKLLRAVERQEVTPVGMSVPRRVDVRFVSAAHPTIEAKRRSGEFRNDLYYRLAALTVELPPLRSRGADVLRLACHLAPPDTDVRRLRAALQKNAGYGWPGNVRELRSFVSRVALLGVDELDQSHARGPEVRADLDWRSARERWLHYFERDYLERLLDDGQTVMEALQHTGLSRSRFYELLRKHDLIDSGS